MGPLFNRCSGIPSHPALLLLLLLLLLQEKEPEKQAAVQAILGLSDGEADNLRAIVAAGGFKVGQEEAEEAAFF